MGVQSLSPERVEELCSSPFSYTAIGGTAAAWPPGYRSLSMSRTLTRRGFDAAVDDLLTWRVHQRAGLRVAASTPRVREGVTVEMRLGVGALSLRIPCRVVYVVDEPERKGFAYGTLPGHPESGEELFLLHRHAEDRTEFTITAFSRPASLLARVGGPAAIWIQDAMTRRYLAAADQLTP